MPYIWSHAGTNADVIKFTAKLSPKATVNFALFTHWVLFPEDCTCKHYYSQFLLFVSCNRAHGGNNLR